MSLLTDNIRKLVQYGLMNGLLGQEDVIYTTNRLLEVFGADEIEECDTPVTMENAELEEVLKNLLDYACEAGLLEDSIVYRDLFDTKLMSVLMPRPSEVIAKFRSLYEKSPQEATDYFYKLSKDSDYIRRYRIKRDMKWTSPKCGTMQRAVCS